ncbi:hypothetical protein LCGC14_1725640 [marine sediment metagenome]|uniref:Uncharacterized protein n=1 Tax=marine sediment metagenome TaxID=412755 RepID=A0A0F9KAW9_9ZZZZ
MLIETFLTIICLAVCIVCLVLSWFCITYKAERDVARYERDMLAKFSTIDVHFESLENKIDG